MQNPRIKNSIGKIVPDEGLVFKPTADELSLTIIHVREYNILKAEQPVQTLQDGAAQYEKSPMLLPLKYCDILTF